MDSSVQSFNRDITGTVDVSDPDAVCDAVLDILYARYTGADFSVIKRVYADFAALYRGAFPGFLACETHYHDMQHVLDVSLAAARLLDGFDRSHSQAQQLGPELAIVGLIVALFHDSGYIRRESETDREHGAEYTRVHVSRSARFMADYLPSVGLGDIAALTGKLVHFTGYELMPEEIELDDPKQRLLGYLIGTADVIAQMSDIDYLEKCRDRLYPEFEIGGIARQKQGDGSVLVVYESAEDLLVKTPQFIKETIKSRLEGHFDSVYRYVEPHFGGRNLYMEALEKNCQHLEQLLASNDRSLLYGSPLRPQP